MSESLTIVDWALCGVAAMAVLLAVYMHVEGNRITATRFAYEDIRRDMGDHPRRTVWWRAFNIAMGWRRRSSSAQRRKVTPIRLRPHTEL